MQLFRPTDLKSKFFELAGAVFTPVAKKLGKKTMQETETEAREDLGRVEANLSEMRIALDDAIVEEATAPDDEKAFRRRAVEDFKAEVTRLESKREYLSATLRGVDFKKIEGAYLGRCAIEEAQEADSLKAARDLHDEAKAYEPAIEAYASGYSRLGQKFAKVFGMIHATPGLSDVWATSPIEAIPKLLVVHSLINPHGNGFSRSVPPGAQSPDMDPRGVEPYSKITAGIIVQLEKAIERRREKRAAENPRRFKRAVAPPKPNGAKH